MPRFNDNGARAKSATPRTIPVSARAASGSTPTTCTTSTATSTPTTCSSTCGASRTGTRWRYPAVYDLVRRLRRRTGIDFDPHWYRHTSPPGCCATTPRSRSSARCSGHSSITTTMDVYGHLTVEDARQALEAAGLLTGQEVRW